MDRYVNETRRLYGVLDKHLQTSPSGFLVGDHLSIADITTIGWVMWAAWANVDIEEFPHLKKWEEKISARPGVKKGTNVPKPINIKERMKDKAKLEEDAKKGSQWILKVLSFAESDLDHSNFSQGMEEDKKR